MWAEISQIIQDALPAAAWLPAEEMSLTLPEEVSVSEWAAQYREFPKDASFPGRWDANKGIYAIAPMDAFKNPQTERITLAASARSVKTEIWLNMLAYVIDQDPGPALVVAPTETKIKRMCLRIKKMIKASPRLRQYLTGNPDDLQKKSIILKHMEIIFSTAGSAADLGEFEAKYVFETETDSYPKTVGDQGSPTQMAEMRARTFWNRKIITESKPTTEDGFIFKDYLRSNQCKYMVPCPHCGGYQLLDFWQLKHRGIPRGQWPRERRDPDLIKKTQAAVYECCFCQAEIEEHRKHWMLSRGVWAALPAQTIGMKWDFENRPRGDKPPPPPASSHQGYWWNALYSPFATWSEIAAKFFEVKDDREQFHTFVNEWLGFPFTEVIQAKEPAAILKLRTSRPSLEVPEGTLGLTAGVDNQKRGCWYSLWAWVRLESGLIDQHLIRYGYCADFTELEIILFQDTYATQSGDVVYPVWRAAIDTGGGEGEAGDPGMTEQVYQWLRLRGRGRIFGVKGSSRPLSAGRKMQVSIIDKMPGKGAPIPGGLKLWILDTNSLKDAFWSRVDSGRVHLFDDSDDAYELFASHLAAEAKERDNRGREVWRQQGNRANHLLDTAVYALAMADPECWGGVNVLSKPEPKAETMAGTGEINPLTHKPRGSFWRR